MARYALVIGISEYQSPRLGNLQKPIKDAEAVARVLEQYGDFQSVKRLPARWNSEKNCFELGLQKVTGDQLGQELRTFLLEQAARNEALIYFSGHGITAHDTLNCQKGFLAASDCQVELAGNRVVEQHGIPLDSLNELIRDSQLTSLVLILDCCHSGYFIERQLIERTLTAFSSSQRDYYLMTACRSHEDALSLKTDEYSLFTTALLKGLALENASRNGRVSGDRLFDYISSELSDISKKLRTSLPEPIRMGWGRSITLVAYPPEEATPEEEIAFNRENPYQGLYAFELEQEKYFCGRELAVRALLERLSHGCFLAVIGPSGCGKSSLVKAGLLPELKRDRVPGSSQWEIESFTPGKNPLGKLIEILERRHRSNQPFVLFIDQFEEIFTLCDNEAERQSFMRLMADEATASEQLTHVIVAIRGDFLDRCAAYPEPAKLINRTQPTTYFVTSLSYEGLEEAIEIPAQLHGVKFERGLVSQITDDVDEQPGALPLLQYALKELWRVCIEEPKSPEPLLTKKGYEQIGGVKGALEKRANLVYQSFSSAEQAFARQLFMELVQLGEGKEVTRRRVRWERLEAIADSIDQLRRVVGQLADQRLIVTDENTVEVAHEALLSEWSLLRGWTEEDRENIRLRRRLEAYCREWQETYKKSDEALLTGARLVAIAEWVEKTQPKLPAEEKEFLQKSLARRDRELRELKIKNKQLKQRAIALAISLGATIASLGIAVIKYGEAKQQGELTEARRLQGLATSILDKDPMQSLLLSLEIAGRGFKPEASSVLWPALRAVKEETYLSGHTINVFAGHFSEDGKYVLTVSFDKTARLWNLERLEEVKIFKEHEAVIVNGAFSKKGQKILTIGYEEKAIIRNISDLFKPIVLPVSEGKLRHGSFSHDGRKVLTVGRDGMAIVWTLDNSGKPIKQEQLRQHYGTILYGSFSPKDANKVLTVSEDGKVRFTDLNNSLNNKIFLHNDAISYGVFNPANPNLILTASDDKTARVWDLNKQDNQPVATLRHQGAVWKANFDPNNPNRVITVSADKTACIWDISKPENMKLFTLEGHQNIIRHGEFAPNNSNQVLTTSEDGTARVWNLNSSNTSVIKDSVILKGHQGYVYLGTFHPTDPNRILTVGQDDIARIWNLKPFSNLQILSGHSGPVYSAVFDPHGLNRVLTVSSDSTARVWNLNNTKQTIILKGHKRDVYSGSFAPHDKNLVLTASEDRTAILWNLKPKVPQILAKFPHEAAVLEAKFSPDGKKVVTASHDRTAKIWVVDVSGNWKLLRTLSHNGLVEYATFSNKGDLVLTTSLDNTGRVWEPEKSNSPVAIFKHNGTVIYGEFAPNDQNRILTVGYDNIAKLWDLKSPNKLIREFKGHKGRIFRGNFSQDSKRILTVSEDGTARIWNTQSKDFIELKGHQALVVDGKFHSKDNNLVVTSSTDGTARLWNLKEPQNPIVLSGHNDAVRLIDIGQTNKPIQIVTASRDGTARIYTIYFWEKLLDSAWKRASRCLSNEEKSSFLINEKRAVPFGSLLTHFPLLKSSKFYPKCNQE